MSLRDFSLFVVICLVWAFNTVAAKVVVADMHVPPLFFGMLRSAVIAIAVIPWLLPMPRPRWRIVVVGFLMGGGGFALFFVGLKTASPSAASIVSQVGVPMATLLSVVVLGETHPLAARTWHRAHLLRRAARDVRSGGVRRVVWTALRGGVGAWGGGRHGHDEADGGHPPASLPGVGRLLLDGDSGGAHRRPSRRGISAPSRTPAGRCLPRCSIPR